MTEPDPEFTAWFQREIVDKMRASSIVTMLLIGEVEWSMALQIGAAVLLDKPICVTTEAGRPIPKHLAAIADEIVEGPVDDPTFQPRLRAALLRMGVLDGSA